MRGSLARRWEIDCLRGVAAVLMVISNFLFDLSFFAGLDLLQSDFLGWFARGVAGAFIFLAGVSLTLSRARQGTRTSDFVHSTFLGGFGKSLRRGLKLMGLGLVVTGVTRLAVGEQMVLFGVLHLIGAGIILAYPFLGRPRLSLVIGVLLLAVAPLTSRVRLGHPWLLWLGLQPHDFSSVDYAPLIPWFGVMLIGVFLGHLFYPGGQPRWPGPDFSRLRLVRALAGCGRHTLLIYFGHQPILMAGIVLSRKWW